MPDANLLITMLCEFVAQLHEAAGDLGLAPGASLAVVRTVLNDPAVVAKWGEAEFVVQLRAASASLRVEMLDRWARVIELSDLDPEPEPEPGDPVH